MGTDVRVNVLVALGIMLLDMFKLRSLPKRWHIPVQVSQPSMQRWISGAYIADIAFEMLHVNRIEADDSCIEANISFSDVLAKVVRVCMGGQMLFRAVKGGEQGLDGLFVGLLGTTRF